MVRPPDRAALGGRSLSRTFPGAIPPLRGDVLADLLLYQRFPDVVLCTRRSHAQAGRSDGRRPHCWVDPRRMPAAGFVRQVLEQSAWWPTCPLVAPWRAAIACQHLEIRRTSSRSIPNLAATSSTPSPSIRSGTTRCHDAWHSRINLYFPRMRHLAQAMVQKTLRATFPFGCRRCTGR